MDLSLRGGTVFDPASGKHGKFDVGIKNGRICAVQASIAADAAQETVDVTGKTLVPGLIGIHTHVYHGGTLLGVNSDSLALQFGVTTFIDAGSAGPGDFLRFHDHVIQRSRSRILGFLSISYAGIYAFDIGVGECDDMKLCNPGIALERAREYVDHIVGIKVRVRHFTSGANELAPLLVAKDAAQALGKPLMSHIDKPPPTIEEVVKSLGSGDILTHCFRPHPNDPVTETGSIKREVLAARERGVVFNVGHGRGALGFGSATRMLELGFDPDVN
jgi:dihydroorotase